MQVIAVQRSVTPATIKKMAGNTGSKESNSEIPVRGALRDKK